MVPLPTFKAAAATLPVRDLTSARTFYEKTLGLSVDEENEGGVMYRVGSAQLFVYPSEFAGTNQATAASVEVGDLDATMRELRDAGVAFEDYDVPGLKTENGVAQIGSDRGAWMKDPDGNIIALIQRGA